MDMSDKVTINNYFFLKEQIMSSFQKLASLDGMTPDEVLDFLENHATRVDETEFMMPLSDEELEAIKLKVFEATAKKIDLDEEYKSIREEFNDKAKELKEFIEDRVTEVRIKAKRQYGRLYRIVDREAKTVYEVASDGVIISKGDLTDDDKQLVINHIKGGG
jgi:hypothetical protein